MLGESPVVPKRSLASVTMSSAKSVLMMMTAVMPIAVWTRISNRKGHQNSERLE